MGAFATAPPCTMSLQIELTRLSAPGTVLLQNLRIDVPDGGIHTVMGQSGSGKSSLLSALAGTLPEGMVFEGSVVLDGQDMTHLPTERRRIGLLFQDDLLFAHMTVHENLLFAVPAGPRAARLQAVGQALRDAELESHAQADPATLSGGQRGRIALMRALLAQPHALLLDEPFAKLDASLRMRMREFVFATVRNRGIPGLMVTHDASDVADPAHLTHL
jgi:putative thiamine transport system ATP-binding protein